VRTDDDHKEAFWTDYRKGKLELDNLLNEQNASEKRRRYVLGRWENEKKLYKEFETALDRLKNEFLAKPTRETKDKLVPLVQKWNSRNYMDALERSFALWVMGEVRKLEEWKEKLKPMKKELDKSLRDNKLDQFRVQWEDGKQKLTNFLVYEGAWPGQLREMHTVWNAEKKVWKALIEQLTELNQDRPELEGAIRKEWNAKLMQQWEEGHKKLKEILVEQGASSERTREILALWRNEHTVREEWLKHQTRLGKEFNASTRTMKDLERMEVGLETFSPRRAYMGREGRAWATHARKHLKSPGVLSEEKPKEKPEEKSSEKSKETSKETPEEKSKEKFGGRPDEWDLKLEEMTKELNKSFPFPTCSDRDAQFDEQYQNGHKQLKEFHWDLGWVSLERQGDTSIRWSYEKAVWEQLKSQLEKLNKLERETQKERDAEFKEQHAKGREELKNFLRAPLLRESLKIERTREIEAAWENEKTVREKWNERLVDLKDEFYPLQKPDEQALKRLERGLETFSPRRGYMKTEGKALVAEARERLT
jgi:hypothetical protein